LSMVPRLRRGRLASRALSHPSYLARSKHNFKRRASPLVDLGLGLHIKRNAARVASFPASSPCAARALQRPHALQRPQPVGLLRPRVGGNDRDGVPQLRRLLLPGSSARPASPGSEPLESHVQAQRRQRTLTPPWPAGRGHPVLTTCWRATARRRSSAVIAACAPSPSALVPPEPTGRVRMQPWPPMTAPPPLLALPQLCVLPVARAAARRVNGASTTCRARQNTPPSRQ